jgi:heterodisulfide reductase subunit C
MLANLIFTLVFIISLLLFAQSVNHIVKNIKIGVKYNNSGNILIRLKNLILVAFGQSKMLKRPLAGIFHIFVYLGFIIVNIEMLEILFDGITGTHRSLSNIRVYPILISFFEFLALLVILTCIVFLFRRNIIKISRFNAKEMTRWPRLDANIILITEIILMSAFLIMNSADLQLQELKVEGYSYTGKFLLSGLIYPALSVLNTENLVLIERVAWWLHIVGVLTFLNYIPYSKHFHILLAFPNVYYSKIGPLAYISNMSSVTKEVKIAMGLAKENSNNNLQIIAFGAKDVYHLSRKSLMDAYSCTECGRCTMVCPANLTGKKLSPRKIVMDTRDRLEEYGKYIRGQKNETLIQKILLRNYISEEEIWACTTCNACTYECPVNIDPVKIIIELRRFIFMEETAAPSTINIMSTNIENNGAPWQYAAADRDNWTKNLNFNNQL